MWERPHRVVTSTGALSSCWFLKHPFIPFLWAAGAKEIVRQCGLLNLLEEGDPVMSDKGFLISDIISF